MKLLVDNGKVFTPDEQSFGMTRYSVFDGESVIDTDNDLIALAKRHGLDPATVKKIVYKYK